MPDIANLVNEPAQDFEATYPNIVRCIVRKAPGSLTDELTVIVPSFSAKHAFQVRYWMPRPRAVTSSAGGGTHTHVPDLLPAVGNRGLLAFDERHEPWLIAWMP